MRHPTRRAPKPSPPRNALLHLAPRTTRNDDAHLPSFRPRSLYTDRRGGGASGARTEPRGRRRLPPGDQIAPERDGHPHRGHLRLPRSRVPPSRQLPVVPRRVLAREPLLPERHAGAQPVRVRRPRGAPAAPRDARARTLRRRGRPAARGEAKARTHARARARRHQVRMGQTQGPRRSSTADGTPVRRRVRPRHPGGSQHGHRFGS